MRSLPAWHMPSPRFPLKATRPPKSYWTGPQAGDFGTRRFSAKFWRSSRCRCRKCRFWLPGRRLLRNGTSKKTTPWNRSILRSEAAPTRGGDVRRGTVGGPGSRTGQTASAAIAATGALRRRRTIWRWSPRMSAHSGMMSATNLWPPGMLPRTAENGFGGVASSAIAGKTTSTIRSGMGNAPAVHTKGFRPIIILPHAILCWRRMTKDQEGRAVSPLASTRD